MKVLGRPERSSAVAHVGAARVGGSAFVGVAESARLFEDKVAESVVAVAFGKHQWEQQVEDDLTIIDGISGNIRDEPMPELGQCPKLEEVNKVK